jgi:hypothetical protein
MPVAAKLERVSNIRVCRCLGNTHDVEGIQGREKNTYKNPVLTPHLADPLIINGVQKLNIIAIIFENARAQPAVCARRRCCGVSAA